MVIRGRYSPKGTTLTATNIALSGYQDISEITTPASPNANNLRLFVEDFKGFSFYSFKDSTGMVRKIVRDSVFVGKNETGNTIASARIVYAAGSVDDVPTIALAQANSDATMPAIGVTVESIANGAYGRVMQLGMLENVNTSSYSAGDILYVSAATAGVPTATAPTYPNVTQEIGTILVDSATVGSVQIIARGGYRVLVVGTDVQAQGAVLDDLNTLGAPTADGEFIVATGAGAFAYETGATARTSLGMGTSDSVTFAQLILADATIDTTASYTGLSLDYIKTAGVTAPSDHLFGVNSTMAFTQNGEEIGQVWGGYFTGRLTLGDASTVRGVGARADLDGGTAASLLGAQITADLDGGTVSGDAYGMQLIIDQESGQTVSGNAYGLQIYADFDGTVTGTNYMLHLNEQTGVDWALYHAGTAASLLGGKLCFTQTDGNEAIDSLNDGYMDYLATTKHRFNANVDVAGNVDVTGNYEVDNVQVVTNQQAHVADATTQDLTGTDSIDQTKLESDLAGIVSTVNTVISKLEAHGLLANS